MASKNSELGVISESGNAPKVDGVTAVLDPKHTLSTPLQLGRVLLKHRVVMAPLTRSRSIQPDDRGTVYTFDAHGYTDYPAYNAAAGA